MKKACVTGAGVRLGKANAVRLARAGYNLILHYNSSKGPVEDTQARCRELGVEAELFQADLSQPDQIQKLAEFASTRFQGLDLLVNNAAIFYPTRTTAEMIEHWDKFHALNVKAQFLTSAYCREALAADGGGSIVNIVDIYARFPLKGYLPYCVAKSGLEAFTRCAALEFAPQVRVNGVSPGAALLPAGADPSEEGRLAQEIPLGRIGCAEMIAEAMFYLAEADFVTGQVIAVDGGRTVNL